MPHFTLHVKRVTALPREEKQKIGNSKTDVFDLITLVPGQRAS